MVSAGRWNFVITASFLMSILVLEAHPLDKPIFNRARILEKDGKAMVVFENEVKDKWGDVEDRDSVFIVMEAKSPVQIIEADGSTKQPKILGAGVFSGRGMMTSHDDGESRDDLRYPPLMTIYPEKYFTGEDSTTHEIGDSLFTWSEEEEEYFVKPDAKEFESIIEKALPGAAAEFIKMLDDEYKSLDGTDSSNELGRVNPQEAYAYITNYGDAAERREILRKLGVDVASLDADSSKSEVKELKAQVATLSQELKEVKALLEDVKRLMLESQVKNVVTNTIYGGAEVTGHPDEEKKSVTTSTNAPAAGPKADFYQSPGGIK